MRSLNRDWRGISLLMLGLVVGGTLAAVVYVHWGLGL